MFLGSGEIVRSFVRSSIVMADEFRVGASACAKMLLHAAKYGQGEVCGLLIGQCTDEASAPAVVEDAIPLFHRGAEGAVGPLVDVALAQVDGYAASRGAKLVGVYVANARVDDKELGTGARRIADAVRRESTSRACILLVDNAGFASCAAGKSRELPLRLFVRHGAQWSAAQASTKLTFEGAASDVVSDMLSKGKQADLVDFSEHVADCTRDWRNLRL